MKRATKPWFFLVSALALAGSAAVAQQSTKAQTATTEQASRADQNSLAPQDQKDGTGVVPSGVKLVPGMPPSGEPRAFEFPQSAAKTLPNGLRVFVVTDHDEPAIAARLVILTAGSVKDPVGMPGVAQMTAGLLTQGTKKRSAQEIAEAIDFIGGSLDASASKDSTTVTLNIVKKDLDTGLDLMSDVALEPAFSRDELERQRQQLLSNLTVQYSDPDYLASLVFSRVVYGGSPYGWPSEGTPETVKKLDRGQLAAFHDANYAPNQSLLAFAGDITPGEAFAAAEKYFGSWPKLDVAATAPAPAAAATDQHIWLIDKPDAVQTQIRAGKLGIRRGDPNYIPVLVMNRILGGGYNSRLNTEVRVKKGLTYGAYSSFNPHRYAGSFTVGTYTRTEATVEATKLVVDLVTQMSSGEVTQKELIFARDYLSGVYPIQSETAEQVADRVLAVAAYDLPADYNRKYPNMVRGVTPEQVREVAQKYLTTNDLDIVLAGNVSSFREALKKEFPNAKYQEIPFDQVDVLAADLRRPKETSTVATPEALEQGKQILLAAAKAAGGDALASVSSMQMKEDGKLTGPNADVPINVSWVVAYPDRSRGDLSARGTNVVQVCDGKSAWVQMPSQTHDATPMLREFLRGISLYGGGWGLYQQVLAEKLGGQSIGEVEIDGKKASGVAVEAPFGTIKLYFDPRTHLLVAARYRSATAKGASDDEQRWSDYRTIEGRQFAYSTVVYRDGVKYMESTIRELNLNPKVDDSLFSKPEAVAAK
jgi:zinc protease